MNNSNGNGDMSRSSDEVDGAAPAGIYSRRSAIKLFGGGMLALVFGGAVLDACGGSSSGSKATGGATATTLGAGVGSPNKVITVLIPADPAAIDPIKYNAHDMERIYRQVTEQLYQWNADKTISPLLASAMPTVSADGLTYTIPLRSGVTFHNGKTFDSSDVKFSYDQVLNPANASIWLAGFGLVESVTATDASTVVVKVKQPYVPLLSSLALIPIVPANVPYTPTTYARSLIGTGPFKFVSWEQGVAIKLAKNETYWQKGLPKSAGVTFSIVSDTASQIADLTSGSAQLIAQVSARDVALIKSRGAKVFVEDSSSIIDYMYPNMQPGAFTSNVNARLAIAWAINRKQVIDQVFAGIGHPESTLPVHGAEFYDSTYGAYFGLQPDLAKAKSYLAKAGGPPSKPLELVVMADSITTPTSTIVQQNLAAAGIPANIISLGEGAALGRLFAQKYDLFLLEVLAQESSGFGAYLAYLSVYPGAFANFNKVNIPELSALVTKAVGVTSNSAQASAWSAVQKAWVSEVPQLLICSSNYIEAASTSLLGYKPTGLAQLVNLKNASVS